MEHAEGERNDDLVPGDSCGPFVLEKVLGQGGMGKVFLASRSDDLKLKVALKTLSNWQPRLKEQLRKETRILSGLKHPNIAHVVDAGFLKCGQPWLAMEYVEGLPLNTFLDQNNPSLKARLDLFLQLCDALIHAHRQMVIHRDLKPGNIMVTPSGTLKLLDFGIAAHIDPDTGEQQTMTLLNQRLMTPNYASPEQINGLRLGAASDVYSAGVVLYEMLAGMRPYQLRDLAPAELLESVNHAKIIRPSSARNARNETSPFSSQLKGDLDTIVLKALERDLARRYASVESLAADLRAYLEGQPIRARPATLSYRFTKFVRRNPWQLTLAATSVLFLIAFSLYASVQRTLIERERDLAQQERQTAQQVTRFLVSMFEQVDPSLSKSEDVSAFEVMEQGRMQLERSLADDPEVRAQIRVTMGRVYRALGRYDASASILSKETDKLSLGSRWQQKMELVHTYMADLRFTQAREQVNELKGMLVNDPSPQREAQLAAVEANLCYEEGNFRSASELFATVDERFLSTEDQMAFIQNRATFSSAQGNYQEAVEAFEDLYQREVNYYGKDHAQPCETLLMLSETLCEKGDCEAGHPLLKRAEDIYRELYGERNPYLVRAWNLRSLLYVYTGEYEAAEPWAEKALEMARSLVGEEHPLYAEVIDNYGYIRLMQGRFEESETLLNKVLDTRLRLLGRNHPLVARSQEMLGGLYMHQAKYDQAEAKFRETLAVRTSLVGQNHPVIPLTLSNLAIVLRRKGELGAAEELLVRSRTMSRNLLGGDHSLTVAIDSDLGSLYLSAGKYEHALPLLSATLKYNSDHQGEDSLVAIMSRRRLGELYLLMGQLEEAGAYFEQTLKLASPEWTRVFYENIDALASLVAMEGDYHSAREIYKQAWASVVGEIGESHAWAFDYHWRLGNIYRFLGDLNEAERHYRNILRGGQGALLKALEADTSLTIPSGAVSRPWSDRASYRNLRAN